MMIVLNTASRCRTRHLPRVAKCYKDPVGINLAPTRSASMAAWKIGDSLDNSNEVDVKSKLKLVEAKIPAICSPSEVLVKVHSTSINPLDVRMCFGYGRRVLDLIDMITNNEARITNDRYPLTLGRDFSGEVVHAGPCASSNYKPGDLVFGAVDPYKSGAHAEYVTVPTYNLIHKPDSLSCEIAASVPFVALTAYSALCTFGHLSKDSCNGKSVLILGGSGGTGSFAIQLLKFWGANVTATCSGNKIEWLENTLLVDRAVNYNDMTEMTLLRGRFDFVLDCGDYERTAQTHADVVANGIEFLKPGSRAVYVTLSPPILKNTDTNGVVLGGAKTAIQALADTISGLRSFNSARWAVFLPNKNALKYITSLYEDGTILPQVHAKFSFKQMPDAYEELQSGRTKGKVIVNLIDEEVNGYKGSPTQASRQHSASERATGAEN